MLVQIPGIGAGAIDTAMPPFHTQLGAQFEMCFLTPIFALYSTPILCLLDLFNGCWHFTAFVAKIMYTQTKISVPINKYLYHLFL